MPSGRRAVHPEALQIACSAVGSDGCSAHCVQVMLHPQAASADLSEVQVPAFIPIACELSSLCALVPVNCIMVCLSVACGDQMTRLASTAGAALFVFLLSVCQ